VSPQTGTQLKAYCLSSVNCVIGFQLSCGPTVASPCSKSWGKANSSNR